MGVIGYDVVLWGNDTYVRLTAMGNGAPDVKNFKNYSAGLTNINLVSKVLRVQTVDRAYFVVFTSLKEVYLIQYNYSSIFGVSVKDLSRHDKISDLSLVSNRSMISQIVDKKLIVIVQFDDFSLYAFNMMNGSQVSIDNGLKKLADGSVLKTASPSILNDGERVWVFGDKSVRVTLASNRYSLLGVSHSGYNITNWSGISNLGSNFSFVFRVNSSRIFGYC